MGGVVKAVAKVASFVAPAAPFMKIASLAFQGYSMMQERKQGKKAASAESNRAAIAQKAEESKSRYSQAQAQRQRIQQQRQARIQQGIVQGQTGNVLGQGGTSGFSGSYGSIGSQTASNIGDINVASGFAQEQSGYNTAMGNEMSRGSQAQAKAQGYQQMTTMASNLPGQVADIFKIDS